MEYLKFNINSSVKVRLKDAGIEHYIRKLNSIMPFKNHISFNEFKSRADEYGFHTFQLWVFIADFGNLDMGLADFVDTDVLFKKTDFDALAY